MNSIIDAVFSRARATVLMLLLAIGVGAIAYTQIPKESMPEVPLPVMYVSVFLEGISPEDSERLLVEPLEKALSTIQGLKKLESVAGEGTARIILEFEPGFDSKIALDNVKEEVDRAEKDLPAAAESPSVVELNTSLFPVLTAVLSGPLPERTLNSIATQTKKAIEGVPGVLEVDVGGQREEMLEVLIDPTALVTYSLSFEEVVNRINRNNRLIAAGALDTGAGRIVLKVPGLIEGLEDLLNMPIKVDGVRVVTLKDVAQIRRTYKDPEGFARINGEPAVSLEIKKRSGANIIETVAAVRNTLSQLENQWPDSLKVQYLLDESKQVKTLLGDLENNVIAAVILVMIVIIGALGVRAGILVGLAIPGSFLAGVTMLWAFGYTLNIVVLFSLILVVGMLVDGAIVTIELADRRMEAGDSPRDAYAHGAKRMAWPIIASTATTLAVFVPLLFWKDMVGQFMKYLPITVLFTLSASLFMALIFIPVFGSVIGKKQKRSPSQINNMRAAETGEVDNITGVSRAYLWLLKRSLAVPGVTLTVAIVSLVGMFKLYSIVGAGISFFPSVEPDFAQVQVRSRDNLSVIERDKLVRDVESTLTDVDGIKTVYARTVTASASSENGEDMIGVIQIELDPWDQRPKAAAISDDIRANSSAVPGVDVQVVTASGGPTEGKAIQIHVVADAARDREMAVDRILTEISTIAGFVDVTDSRPVPGVEWLLVVDRQLAARYGADIESLGQSVQLLTKGINVAEYRPADVDGSVDIRVRFKSDQRTLAQLEQLRVPTPQGAIPISNFVSFKPAPKVGVIERLDRARLYSIESNVADGAVQGDMLKKLQKRLTAEPLPDNIKVSFAGESEDQASAMTFLMSAFVAAIFAMFLLLLIQFNSFYQAGLVLSAIVFSIAGVLLGLMVTGRPFGIVMGGIGVISLAGIVVNNNIVLIDTFNEIKEKGYDAYTALLMTGAQRLRPVLLTSLTTVLGLLPMVFALNLNFASRVITVGAPSTQYWVELSSAVAGGLVVATLLTLVLTPAMLMLGERFTNRNPGSLRRKLWHRKSTAVS